MILFILYSATLSLLALWAIALPLVRPIPSKLRYSASLISALVFSALLWNSGIGPLFTIQLEEQGRLGLIMPGSIDTDEFEKWDYALDDPDTLEQVTIFRPNAEKRKFKTEYLTGREIKARCFKSRIGYVGDLSDSGFYGHHCNVDRLTQNPTLDLSAVVRSKYVLKCHWNSRHASLLSVFRTLYRIEDCTFENNDTNETIARYRSAEYQTNLFLIVPITQRYYGPYPRWPQDLVGTRLEDRKIDR